MKKFNFCPVCGERGIAYNVNKWFCAPCGFTLYNSVAAAAALILYDDEGCVLFERREKEPKRGLLALPGGFVSMDEEAETSLKRECMEEMGYSLSSCNYLASFPNFYPYKNIDYRTCDIYFTHRLKGESVEDVMKTLTRQKEEVSSFASFRILSASDIESLDIAFVSNERALKLFVNERYTKNLPQ